jgi:secretion/DNA translocation related TadE-like protein
MQGVARRERGSATALIVGIMGVVVVLSSAALLIAGYAVGFHRARAAADLSALSGAAAFQQGREPCAQAALTARQNGARVDRCSQMGDAVDFVVTVRVSVVARTRIPNMPRTVGAEAHAGPVDGVRGVSLGTAIFGPAVFGPAVLGRQSWAGRGAAV